MPHRSPFPMFGSGSDSRTALLQGLMIGAIVIGGLYIGREVLLPLALAILLSFVLTPLLLLLRTIKVPRLPALGIVVTLAFAIIFGLGWMLSHQVAQLASDLPRYQHVLAGKISALRKSAESSGTFDNIAGALKSIEDEISQRAGPVPAGTAATPSLEEPAPNKPIPSRGPSRFCKTCSARCCRRSPPPVSSYCSLFSSCCSARICATAWSA